MLQNTNKTYLCCVPGVSPPLHFNTIPWFPQAVGQQLFPPLLPFSAPLRSASTCSSPSWRKSRLIMISSPSLGQASQGSRQVLLLLLLFYLNTRFASYRPTGRASAVGRLLLLLLLLRSRSRQSRPRREPSCAPFGGGGGGLPTEEEKKEK